ncbi:hypothetical protein [Desulfofundulus thermocisternus]|uniref:hypothetical protein n=1 Tax=Desulfofundulus thermocisternus TaxID=42471 RepID=UPI00217D1764|nr:hypothetical protein [Desulfofundulus thermocisternus]MCS5695632.1 hypothetical protein [Desulfofundulus thermocisternus]
MVINLVLSGDNALVIALACCSYPGLDRRRDDFKDKFVHTYMGNGLLEKVVPAAVAVLVVLVGHLSARRRRQSSVEEKELNRVVLKRARTQRAKTKTFENHYHE